MNKPKRIQELFKSLNNNMNKSECGVYLLGQSCLHVGCIAWTRAENGDYSQGMNRYFDLLIMILEAANRDEQWAVDLLADLLVRAKP